MIRTRVIATSASVPEQIITNDDLARIVDPGSLGNPLITCINNPGEYFGVCI